MAAKIAEIEYYLPEKEVTNEEIAKEFPQWTVEKIYAKTGIMSRHVSAQNEFASDLAVKAANKLFEKGSVNREEIEFILYCTQSPDYYLPTTACLIQERLGLRTSCGALDFNLGCSGFVYGLSLAKGLLESESCRNVLLITSETYTKFINAKDRSVRTLFGDGAAATYIVNTEEGRNAIGPFIFGTDGRGGKNLIVPAGGVRLPRSQETNVEHEDDSGNIRSDDNLFMAGPEIFTFTLSSVPRAINSLLEKTGYSLDDIDLFVFHQANKFMIETLRVKCKIPANKFIIDMERVGNTVSATIPIALKGAIESGKLTKGMKIMVAGFGVGYSWAVAIIEW